MHIQEVLKNHLETKDVQKVKFDHMIYVRLFEGCNLSCEHCFIPSNPKKIESIFYQNKGLTETLIKEGNIKEGSTLFIQWHGGEPTLLGVEYLRNAIEEIEKDTRFKYIHGIQTNLINFHNNTDEWVDLYKKYFNGSIGVSWDADIRHVKRKELTNETNQEFESIFWKNIKLAQDNGLEIYMVVTATKRLFEKFKNPINFFIFMNENKIKKLNFERITKTGVARNNWDKLGLNNLEYSTYMSKFFKAYLLYKQNAIENNLDDLNISPFDGLLESVISLELKNQQELNREANIWDILSFKNQGYGCWSGSCDTTFHTIDSNGYKHGCTALTSEQDNKTISKDISKKIIWIGSTNMQQKENIVNTRKERQLSCVGCEFLTICSSGCLSVEKFDESKECSGAKLLFKTIQENVVKSLTL